MKNSCALSHSQKLCCYDVVGKQNVAAILILTSFAPREDHVFGNSSVIDAKDASLRNKSVNYHFEPSPVDLETGCT